MNEIVSEKKIITARKKKQTHNKVSQFGEKFHKLGYYSRRKTYWHNLSTLTTKINLSYKLCLIETIKSFQLMLISISQLCQEIHRANCVTSFFLGC